MKYKNVKTNLNGAHSRNNLPKIEGGANVINLDKCKSIDTHWIALYVDCDNLTYFDIFGVEHIWKEIKNLWEKKNFKKNYRILAYDSICGYFCISLIEFMLKGKSSLDYTNLFSPNAYKKSYKIS